MKIFRCPSCASTVYFENTHCLSCGSTIGFDSNTLEFSTLGGLNLNEKRCRNHSEICCNWLPHIHGDEYCLSCKLTENLPSHLDTITLERWAAMESAKRRLIYQLLKLGIFEVKPSNQSLSLSFDFLNRGNRQGRMTGHANGVVTILLPEADSVEREKMRKQMSEPYRTLIGHFRHEVGHFYWLLFFVTESDKNEFSKYFGDYSMDYATSLENYYRNGAPANWQDQYISRYASSHPLEDWAETWAHYLHILDTLETAHYAGLGLQTGSVDFTLKRCPNPYNQEAFEIILDWGIKLTSATNSLNRSMGIADIYPYVIVEPVIDKLNFIDLVVRRYYKN